MAGSTQDSIRQIRRHLARGNALTANAMAIAALESGQDSREIRYLYLRSLADTGSTRLALRRYESLAPPTEERDEDWLALPARLHKDLAFSGEDTETNIDLAAAGYECVFARTGGSFPAVNAATLNLLAGREDSAHELARQALGLTGVEPPADEIACYYWYATRAEAQLVLGDVDACAASLRAADPLCRNDLLTRSRTRQQISRILAHHGMDGGLIESLQLPWAYVIGFDEDGPDSCPDIPAGMWQHLDGSPVFCRLSPRARAFSVAEALLKTGARLHLVAPQEQVRFQSELSDAGDATLARRAKGLLKRCELFTPLRGFLEDEPTWRLRQQQRQAHGMARITAGRFASGVRALELGPQGWRMGDGSEPPELLQPSPSRRMLGLVFSDMVGFAKLDDVEIRQYWTQVLPEIVQAIQPYARGILLRRTWGDAIHIATTDALTAAQICLAMLDRVQQLRPRLEGRLAQLELRIGAHFAPAFADLDALEDRDTFFGSQLSFAARVEPVTPPGTTFISEALCAELELEAPGRFRTEYVGEMALAKRYGSFRLYNLVPRANRH